MSEFVQSRDKEHKISMISREKLDVSGVIDVLDFDNNCINIKTNMGVLSVEGADLKIISFSKDSEAIYVEGKIDNLYYYNVSKEKRSGLFRRKEN